MVSVPVVVAVSAQNIFVGSKPLGYTVADGRGKKQEPKVPAVELIREVSAPRVIRPDTVVPQPHKMGLITWERQKRKLDALFAIYILGWHTLKTSDSEVRAFIKPIGKDQWAFDIVPYAHDDVRIIRSGIEILRQKQVYITTKAAVNGYEVVVENSNILVRDKDVNFAEIACCLLWAGLKHDVIQAAWNGQDDYSTKYQKRLRELRDAI